jgi:hypothetical protein
MVQKDEDYKEERDYLLTGEPDIVKPLTMHLLATLERFEELEQKVDFIVDLLAEIRQRRSQGEIKKHPKITLYFEQHKKDITGEYRYPIDAQVSFRWMKHTLENICNDETAIKQMAQSIKAKFVKPLFFFDKGKKVGMYHDPVRGFNWVWSEFKDEVNAKKVFEQVLDLQQKSPDWECLNISESALPNKAYPEKTDKKMVLGELVRNPRRRPLGRVYFKYAYITLPPKKKPIYLIDVSGKKDALIDAD